MNDRATLIARSPQEMAKIGASLVRALYAPATDIVLIGEVGSGKTTLAQGIARATGVDERVPSPTYALERRYPTARGTFVHIDLYRIGDAEATALVGRHEGEVFLRCIETPPGRPLPSPPRPAIVVTLHDDGAERSLDIAFHDASVPSPADIAAWRAEARLPAHVAAHCDCVATVALRLAEALRERGAVVRPGLLEAAARLHDLLRFVDFRAGGGEFPPPSAEDERVWGDIAKRYAGLHHEEACARWLSERGYPEAARIVRTHGVALAPGDDATMEQWLVYYADKRCMGTSVVSVTERFEDFRKRYGDSRRAEAERWMQTCRHIEQELFPEGAPDLRVSS